MKHKKLLKIWSRKASAPFNVEIVRGLKSEVLNQSTKLMFMIDNYIYRKDNADMITLNNINKQLQKLTKKLNKMGVK